MAVRRKSLFPDLERLEKGLMLCPPPFHVALGGEKSFLKVVRITAGIYNNQRHFDILATVH